MDFPPCHPQSRGVLDAHAWKVEPGSRADRYTPTGRGFDTYLGYLSADEQYFTHYKWPPYSGGKGGPCDYNASLPSLYNITDLSNGTNTVDAAAYNWTYSTFMYAAEAERIISTAAARRAGAQDGGAPFFLYLAAQSIHTPLEAPDEYLALYPDAPNGSVGSDAQVVHAMVTSLDDLVGNVTGALQTGGLWEHTLLIFTADNGGDTHGNNFPLRGGKFTTWEGGLRVVGAAAGGALSTKCSGGVADGLIHICDWHATLAFLAGVTINATGPRPLDSINVWPHLASCGAQPSPRTTLLHHYDGPDREGHLKIIIGSMSPYCWDSPYPDEATKHCTPGTGDPHPRDWSCRPCADAGPDPCPSGSPCLFNITVDPLEQHNLANSMPEVVDEMVRRYTALGADACTPHLGSCLDYVGVADQAAWVQHTLDTMHIGPLPGAGDPLLPPPSPSPLDPGRLAGMWTIVDSGVHSRGGTVTLTLDSSAVHVTAACPECCWDSAVGTVAPSGRLLNITATSATCTRFSLGHVTSDSSGNLTIVWACRKGASRELPCQWPAWTKL